MDYIVPDNFYKFKSDWYQNIDFDYESELLLDVLNQASRKMIFKVI